MKLPDLYFAFGSNLETEQMATRCPGSSVFLRGQLAGYRLAFMGNRSEWGDGGMATIEEVAGARADAPNDTALDNTVPGLLYRMTPADVEALNGFENYPATYDQLLIEVAAEDGVAYPAFTYQRVGAPANPPSMKYFHQIWRSYKAFGLDEAALLAAIERSLNHRK